MTTTPDDAKPPYLIATKPPVFPCELMDAQGEWWIAASTEAVDGDWSEFTHWRPLPTAPTCTPEGVKRPRGDAALELDEMRAVAAERAANSLTPAKPWSSFANTVPDDLAGGAPQATDTPRTDAEEVHHLHDMRGYVPAPFARQLERELAEAKAQSDYHASEYHRLLGLMREQNAHTNVVEAQLTEAQAKLAARATLEDKP